MKTPNCSNCQHWALRQNPAMAKQGFAPCALGKPWKMLPPKHTCSSHKQTAQDVQSARDKWLARSAA